MFAAQSTPLFGESTPVLGESTPVFTECTHLFHESTDAATESTDQKAERTPRRTASAASGVRKLRMAGERSAGRSLGSAGVTDLTPDLTPDLDGAGRKLPERSRRLNRLTSAHRNAAAPARLHA